MIHSLKRLARRLNKMLQGGHPAVPPEIFLPVISDSDLEFIRARFPRPKFFIMGHARSGTTLLGRLIRVHPEVHCDWQLQFFSERGMVPSLLEPQLQAWLNHPSNHWTEGIDLTAAALRLCCDYILEREAEKIGKRIVGDKSVNGNGGQAVEWLASIYPDAHLIYIVRDGRDTVLSKRVQLFIDQPEHLAPQDRKILAELKSDPEAFLAGRRSFFTASWLEEAAGKWAEDVKQSIAVGRNRFAHACHIVRFEDLIIKPVDSMTHIWSLLGAAPPTELRNDIEAELQRNPSAEWHESLGIDFVQELPRGVHGGWKEVFTQADEKRFSDVAGSVLSEFEYS